MNILLMEDPYSTNKNYTNLGQGAHTVAVRDDNGCIILTTVTITSSGGPTDVNVNTTLLRAALTMDQLHRYVSGGSAPYEYSVDGDLIVQIRITLPRSGRILLL
jgi:hypothetical protein